MTVATVLMIEDNAALREMTRRRLERLGFQMTTAANGEEGLRLLCETRPDIVLLDISLPGRDGWSIAREIKRKDNALPVIAITAHAMIGDREKALQSGFDEYVSKPIDFKQLAEKMERFLA